VEVLAKTNSANYTGTELNVNWSNRNVFKGAELLTISAFGGLEVQVSGLNNGFNVYRFGTEANLVWPRIISPFHFVSSGGFVPKTKATIGYEFKTEPSCIHYKHSKVLLAIYGRKMNAKNISSISLKLLMLVLKT
jgi:hypothetical protein